MNSIQTLLGKRAYKKAKKVLSAKETGEAKPALKKGGSDQSFLDQQQLRNLKFELEQVRQQKEDLDEEKTKLDIVKKRLYRLARADDKLNNGEQNRQTTNPLKFGDTIQFKHKYSDKFLCIKEASSAMLEPNAVRVTMQDFSSKDCLFKIMPRFKVTLTLTLTLTRTRTLAVTETVTETVSVTLTLTQTQIQNPKSKIQNPQG